MKTNLLPAKVKLIGIALVILGFIVPIILGMMNPQTWEDTQLRRTLAQTTVLLGLLLFISSREKIEDEFITHCRLKAAAFAFAFGIVFYIVSTFIEFRNLKSADATYSAFRILLSQALFYVLMFQLLLRGTKRN